MAAAGGDVDDAFGACLMSWQELHEPPGSGRPPVLRIARVQMQDGGAGLGRADRVLRDLVRASAADAATSSACGSSR